MSEDSEENENQKKLEAQKGKTTDINITLDRNSEIEALNKRNGELEAQLEQNAIAHFEEKCKHYGINPLDEDALSKVKAEQLHEQVQEESGIHSPPKGGETASLQGQYQDLYHPEKIDQKTADQLNILNKDMPCELLGWSSEESMVSGLKKISEDTTDPRAKEARKLLVALTRRAGGLKNAEWEYDSGVTSLGKLNPRKGKFKRVDHDEP